MYKSTICVSLFLGIPGGSKDRLERYIHDHLFSKLAEDEKKNLGIISIYRFPVPEDCLAMNDDVDFEKLFVLKQKSIVKKDALDRYFLHDIIKEIFYRNLSLSERRKHHLFAARWYENRDEPIDFIEAVYHYLQAGEYEKASQFAIDSSASIFDGGCAAEFLVTLETFDEKHLDTRVWAEMLILKGKACYISGVWEKALFYFTQSADTASIIGDKKLEVKAICESGLVLEEQNELEKAMESFKKCLEISEEADYPLGIGGGYRGLGRIHWRKSEHEKAISNLKKAIEIFDKTATLDLKAATYIDLGNVYDERYETEEAIDSYNNALAILKKSKNAYETARAYGNLAITYRHMDDFEKAIEYHEKQLELAENLRHPKVKGYGVASISYCFAKIDEFEKAQKYAEKAEDIALKIGSENIMFDVYKTYGLIFKHEKRLDEAIGYFRKSVEIVDQLNALYYLSDSYFELGLLYEEVNEPENAEKQLNMAMGLYDKLGLVGKAELVRERLSKYH